MRRKTIGCIFIALSWSTAQASLVGVHTNIPGDFQSAFVAEVTTAAASEGPFTIGIGPALGTYTATSAVTSANTGAFSLDYASATNTATFTVGSNSVQYQPTSPFNEIFITTTWGLGVDESFVGDIALDGQALTGANSDYPYAGPESDSIRLSGVPLSGGFSLTSMQLILVHIPSDSAGPDSAHIFVGEEVPEPAAATLLALGLIGLFTVKAIFARG